MNALTKEKATDVYVANTTFSTDLDGAPVTITKGVTRVRAGHPLVTSNPQYFVRVDDNVTYDVEQATAVPGEQRGQEGPSKDDLLERARELDVAGRSQMDKDELAGAVAAKAKDEVKSKAKK